MEVYGQLILTFYVGELRCRGKATRNGRQEKCRAALTMPASSHNAKTKLIEGEGALTNSVEGPRGVCEPRPSRLFRRSKTGHGGIFPRTLDKAVALSRRLGGTRCPRRKYTKALAVASFAMFPLACPW